MGQLEHEDGNGNGGGVPGGGVYDWYRRGVRLLEEKHPAAAVQLLARAAEAEPGSGSIREALARAQFDAGQYGQALASFRAVAEADPSDDYAQFGWGCRRPGWATSRPRRSTWRWRWRCSPATGTTRRRCGRPGRRWRPGRGRTARCCRGRPGTWLRRRARPRHRVAGVRFGSR
ncbi:tetratricopeptide repeat protein [Kitasatospora saccharophila]|uniref:tetratricopeptide repeat protein n=1 Tax=Kitasatospora saccharophila TaxID=407973 RepID=UPI00362B29E3